ncbi:MAG: phosphate ABC transporter permease PstA [Anaerosomatales bacterium]|nr:phosphate ABC transporter permease PstA [Anaerosomatales bacterium]MDT8434394.1 phosphate ABC transporter permease PstA [Anaerosomatales bacterium]
MNRIKRARTIQTVAVGITGAAAAFIIAAALFLLVYIVVRGAPAISWEFLTDVPRKQMKEGGILPAIVGTLALTLGTAAFALPIGVAAGIYLSEYAPRGRSTRLIRLAISNMAGVPSIVYGLFGLALFVILLDLGKSILAGALTLACLTLPVIITATEEALRQIPSDLRQASLALGATRWRTIYRIVLPAAAPGIVTGSILGLSRAAGETAPILFTAAVYYKRQMPDSVFADVMVLPYHIFILATQVTGRPDDIIWGTALVLVGGVTAISVAAATWRSIQRRKVRW